MAVFDLGRLLLVLSQEHVEFIIVGGVAAALHCAPVLTRDVDILYRIEDGNLERLERALSRIRAALGTESVSSLAANTPSRRHRSELTLFAISRFFAVSKASSL